MRSAIMRDYGASVFDVIGNRPGFGLRGLIGEGAWAELFAGTSYDDDDYPLGWDERGAKI